MRLNTEIKHSNQEIKRLNIKLDGIYGAVIIKIKLTNYMY